MNIAPLSSRRIVAGCTLACTSGGLATLSFAPFDHWWLIWFAFVPMIVAQHRILPRAYSALGPALGIGGFMAGYFGGFFPERAAWYMKGLPFLVAGLVFLVSRNERPKRELAGYAAWPLAAAASWVATELLRSFVPALGTWGFVGYALYRQAWLIQPVRIFGIFGLDLLIVLVNYASAMAVLYGLDRAAIFEAAVAVSGRLAARWCGGALGALAAWCALSSSGVCWCRCSGFYRAQSVAPRFPAVMVTKPVASTAVHYVRCPVSIGRYAMPRAAPR